MKNILLVDDDIDLLMVLKRSLAVHGFAVTTLSDPSLVQQMIDKITPKVVILDINMGEWDGREICKWIKDAPGYHHIPVILYSALEDRALALETCKADLFLKKPVTIQQLVTHLFALQQPGVVD